MSLRITEACINCDICEPVCPNEAIYRGINIYEIASHKCTECVGHFDVPQCQTVCPVECIVIDEVLNETQPQLWTKYHTLTDKNIVK